MNDIEAFEKEFVQLFCEDALVIPANLSTYDVRLHKTVTCIICHVAHAVDGEQWKQFRQSVNSSSLSHEQKMVFLNQGVKPKVFAEQNQEIILNSTNWVVAAEALKQHQKTLRGDNQQLCGLGEPLSSQDAQKGLQRFCCTVCSTVHVLHPDVLTALSDKQLRRKQQIAVQLETKIPALLVVHAEKLLAEQIQDFQEHLQLEYVFDSAQFSDALTKLVDGHEYSREEVLNQHPLQTTVFRRKDGSIHFLPSHIWQKAHDDLALNKKYLQRDTIIYLDTLVGRKVLISETAFEDLLDCDEQWQQHQKRLTDIHQILQEAAIHAKHSPTVEGVSPRRKITPSMKPTRKDRVNYYPLSEEDYESLVEQLEPQLLACYEYFTQTTKLTEVLGLLQLRKMLRRAFGVIDEESFGEKVSKDFLYVEDRNLSDELMVEFHVCGRKQGHRTKALALMEIIMNGKLQSTIYVCDYCTQHHYGLMTQSVKSLTDFAGQGRIHYRDDIQKANRFTVKKNLAWA